MTCHSGMDSNDLEVKTRELVRIREQSVLIKGQKNIFDSLMLKAKNRKGSLRIGYQNNDNLLTNDGPLRVGEFILSDKQVVIRTSGYVAPEMAGSW